MSSCPLCERDVPELSRHHLIPRSRGGKETEPICLDCHSAIHKFFDNKMLGRELNSVEALLTNQQFAKHIKWLSKRPGDQRFKTLRSRDRKRGKYS